MRIICGPAGSGKSHKAREVFLAASAAGGSPLLIAPGAPDARHFQRDLLRQAGILTEGEVTTFGNLCRDLLKGAGLDLRIIGGIERNLLLRSVVDKTSNLSFLNESSVYPGFIETLGNLISELQGACIAPRQLAADAKSILHDDLNRDLYRLYENYRAALSEQEVTDEELAQCQAVECLLEDPALLRHETVIIDGFWDFTAIETSIISALEGTSVDLLVTAPYEPAMAATASVGEALEGLMAEAECEFLEARDDGRRPPALFHLDRHLFNAGGEKQPSDGAVRILKGAGGRGEAELVASEILRLWRSGSELDDIAIVYRSLGAEAGAMTSALRDSGVPYEMNAPVAIADTPLGRTLLALTDFLISRQAGAAASAARTDSSTRRNFTSYLQSALPVADTAQADMFAREAGLHGIEDPDDLVAAWERYGGRKLREIDELAAAAGDGIGALSRACLKLARRLASGAVGDSEDAAITGFPDGEADPQPLQMLIKLCDQAGRMDDTETRGAAALELFRKGLAAATRFPTAGRLRDCVRILDPHRILNQSFDIVFLCGLEEGRFPHLGSEDPFITDAARVALAEKGLDLRTRSNRLDDERFLFYRAVTRARDRVYLSYPYCTSEGKDRVGSLFVDEVEELVEVEPGDRRKRKISEVAFSPGEAPTRKQALLSLCLEAGERSTAPGKLSAKARERLWAAAAPVELEAAMDRILKAVISPAPELLDRENAAIFAQMTEFHASRLERYAGCPFQYLVEHAMKPAMMAIDTYFLDRGCIAHEVLARFLRETKSHISLCDADETEQEVLRDKMRQVLDEELEQFGVGHDADGELLRFTLREIMDRFIDRELECSPALRPDSLELNFGGDGDDIGAVNLGDGLTLRGRIDRVDRIPGSDLALVIDYKTGDVSSWKKYGDDQLVQVPLYVLALRAAGMSPIGGEYYSLRKNIRRGFYLEDHSSSLGREANNRDLVSEETFEQIIKEACGRALALAKGIRERKFPVEPQKGVCDFCGYAAICRDSQAGSGRRFR